MSLLPFANGAGLKKPTLGQSATIYVTTTGSDSNDGLSWATAKATVQGAINALAANGGVIQLGYGTFNVTSSARTDTGVSFSAGTWTDTHITSGDVGSYVLGANINNAEVPKIISVIASTSFVTDISPSGSISNQSVIIVSPGFVLPPGVIIRGMGPVFSNSAGIGPGMSSTTQILDSGTGVTCLIRGGSGSGTAAAQYRLDNLSIHGTNSTLYGVYVGNFAWYLVTNNCSLSYHGVAGLALDGNINSDSFYDTYFLSNGTVGATGFTGGVLTHPYYLQASAACNFYNCFFDQNYGWGIVDPQASGACGVGLIECQFNVTNASAKANSGIAAALTDHANGADAKSFIVGGWAESSAKYDLDLYGSPTIVNFTMGSSLSNAHAQVTSGNAQFLGCRFENGSSASLTFGSGGNASWWGTTFNDSFAYSGCGFSNANAPLIGSSGNNLRIGGLSLNAVTKSSNSGLSVDDSTVLVSGNTTITLPDATLLPAGRQYTIKKTDLSNTVTINTTSSQTIDGATTATITAQYASITVQSDGTNWQVI